jgi:hypothetical protein
MDDGISPDNVHPGYCCVASACSETGAGGPVIVGAENGDVLRLESFLSRNGHPHQRLNPGTDPEAKGHLEK